MLVLLTPYHPLLWLVGDLNSKVGFDLVFCNVYWDEVVDDTEIMIDGLEFFRLDVVSVEFALLAATLNEKLE